MPDLTNPWEWENQNARLMFNDALLYVPPETGWAIFNDDGAKMFYYETFFDLELTPLQRQDLYHDFVTYMEETYDVDWHEIFDWEWFREDYDEARG